MFKKDIDCILKLYEWEIYTLPVPWSGGTTVVDLTAWLMNIESGINPDRRPLNDTPVIFMANLFPYFLEDPQKIILRMPSQG